MNEGKELIGVKLHIHEEPCDVGGAVKKAIDLPKDKDDQLPFILAYTPAFCGFVDPSGEGLASLGGPGKGKFHADDIFELRCFYESFELRWVREGKDGKGRAVILSEEELDGLAMSKLDGDFFRRPGQYILWGKSKGQDGPLFEHRVGELPLPIKVPKDARACLTFVEYFREDKYGNMAWHSERLTGLSVLSRC